MWEGSSIEGWNLVRAAKSEVESKLDRNIVGENQSQLSYLEVNRNLMEAEEESESEQRRCCFKKKDVTTQAISARVFFVETMYYWARASGAL